MHINLVGKKALVGGASGGIGKAVAVQLASSGATVTLMSRTREKLEQALSELDTGDGQTHDYLVVDFNDFQGYKKIIEDYFAKTEVDILVNNTHGPKAGSSLELQVDDYQVAFDLLFKSVVHTTHLAIEHMRRKGWGRIVNVASISVREPLSYLALSNSIRAAVVTWAKSLATDLAADHITVNSILTGYFDTERIHDLNEKKAAQLQIPVSEVQSKMASGVPVKRIGQPKEYGYLVAFLVSEKASYITGTAIPLDGGLLRSL